MTSAAPTAGRSAAYPGNGVPLEKRTAAQPIAARPSHPYAARALGAQSASAAPSASSQARAKVEKYAVTGEAAVSRIDQASEVTPIAATTSTSRRRAPPQSSASATIEGQTR